jgi:hypothetical protein
MTRPRTTLIRRAATPAEVQAGRPAWYGSRIARSHGVAPRCDCPETGNDPEALLARWAFEDAIDNAAKEDLA